MLTCANARLRGLVFVSPGALLNSRRTDVLASFKWVESSTGGNGGPDWVEVTRIYPFGRASLLTRTIA